MIKKNNSLMILGLLLFILYIVSFFRLNAVPVIFWATGFKTEVPFWGIQIFLLVYTRVYKTILFKRIFVWYVLLILFNFITCYYYRDQSIFVSYRAWFPMFLILYYPFFKFLRLKAYDWERILFGIFLILLIGYTLQNIFLKVEIFHIDTGFERLDLETRIRIWSDGILTLGALFCLNKCLCGNKKLLFIYIWASVILFLQGYRMILLMYAFISMVMFIRIMGVKSKIILYVPLILLVVYGISKQKFAQDKIDEIVYRNDTSNLNNSDYCRVLCFNHYTNNHFINGYEHFWGSGRTINVSSTAGYSSKIVRPPSKYSKYVSGIGSKFHWYAYDWGLIGLSWEAGIPFMLVFVWLIISVIRTKVPVEYIYIGMWELFLLLIGATNELIFNQCNMIYQALILVILDRVRTFGGETKKLEYFKKAVH